MIRVYPDGAAFLLEHTQLLQTNPYLATFFFLDAQFLKTTDRKSYAICAGEGKEYLLAMKLDPYSLLLFGSDTRLPELLGFLVENAYTMDAILGEQEMCAAAARILKASHGIVYQEALAMDFMEAKEITEPSSQEPEIPTENDIEELIECKQNFHRDCGLLDPVNAERMRSELDCYRVLRRSGRIASMAYVSKATDSAMKISQVYTRPEFRGQGLARIVVNALKNEILSSGYTAVLNVDKQNPVSNHLYESLGFRRVFSQSEFRRV